MKTSRQALRQLIRTKRNQLTSDQQYQASQDLIRRFSELPELTECQHIALYLSVDGEIDTQPLIEWLWHQGKQIYLPVLHPFSAGNLLFLHYQPDTEMVFNKYQIIEPRLKQSLIKPVSELDMICTPLVGFDNNGHRLGMGGGFYDRTLAPWYQTRKGAIPVGLAHDCQFVETLPIETWDIPLPRIVTPDRIWQWEI